MFAESLFESRHDEQGEVEWTPNETYSSGAPYVPKPVSKNKVT